MIDRQRIVDDATKAESRRLRREAYARADAERGYGWEDIHLRSWGWSCGPISRADARRIVREARG